MAVTHFGLYYPRSKGIFHDHPFGITGARLSDVSHDAFIRDLHVQ